MRPGQEAAPGKSAQDLAEDHELRILRARQRCRVVVYQGKNRYVAGVCLHKDDAEMVVYLTGSADAVRPGEITFQEQPT